MPQSPLSRGLIIATAIVAVGLGLAQPTVGSTAADAFAGMIGAASRRVSRGSTGVFEIGARISTIDLRARKIEGEFERDATLDLSWYPDTNIRLMADYVRAHADPAAASAGGRPIDSNIFIGGAQVFW